MDVTNLFSDISMLFVVFAIAAIAGMISERAGVINISIEGYMIIGALVFSITGHYLSGKSNWMQLLAMVFAVAVCGVFSLLQSLSSIKLKSNQIISGTAINILAQGIAMFLATCGLFGNGTQIMSGFTKINLDGGSGIFTLYLIIGVILIALVGVYFTFTRVGKWHIAAGENPNALDAVGINVVKFRWSAATVSGALAGLAGCFFILFQRDNFVGTTNGYGYLALAVMIIGQWRTSYITIAGLAFATFFACAQRFAFSDQEWVKTNKDLVNTLPFVVSLIIMVGASKWSKVPKADGIPFDKSKR
jgi:ABC-type uncharacterized transport system permease subunit